MAGASPYWNPKTETLGREQLESLQLAKLRYQCEWAAARSPWYERAFTEAGFHPSELRTIADLRRLPLLTRDQWMLSQEAKPPYGDLPAIGPEGAIRVHTTSGTTGRGPLRALDSRKALIEEQWGAKAFDTAGMTEIGTIMVCTDNIVLLGDAAHTAHFSIGSGTKLAMEDAVALAWVFKSFGDDVDRALSSYEEERRPVVESTQRAAQASLEWFEGLPRYVEQPRLQFAFNLLTRSRRVTYENLRLRDPAFVAAVHPDPWPPMFTRLHLRGLELPNRVVVSPMDMYSAQDGVPSDFHLVHPGARSLGGAGLVMSEMMWVSQGRRITPGCAGMYRSDHVGAWRRIVAFAHDYGGGAIGAQLGHSGRKGSTKLMWDGIDEPLESGNWEVIAPSPVPYGPRNQVPREMAAADFEAVLSSFVWAARACDRAGSDLLEIHCAHGYLLSLFLSPLTNLRADRYGGSLAGRARFPLEVFDACRAVWPAPKPMSVRISATDWVHGGFDDDDAVAFAGMLRKHGCDIVDVSSGQVSPLERPAYGRSFQTPFADRIRNEVGIPTIAVGSISSYDDVNTVVRSGRADLCALARPHIYDPHWRLHAAADQGVEVDWVSQYRAGSRTPPAGRDPVAKDLQRTFEPIALDPQL